MIKYKLNQGCLEDKGSFPFFETCVCLKIIFKTEYSQQHPVDLAENERCSSANSRTI